MFALVAECWTNKDLGGDLGLAEKTVKSLLSNVFKKSHET